MPEADHRRFMAYYTQAEERSDPVAADLLVVSSDQPDGPRLAVPDNALDVEEVMLSFSALEGAIVKASSHPPCRGSAAAMRHRASLARAPPALARPQPEQCR